MKSNDADKSGQHLRVAVVWHGTVYDERTFTETSDPKISFGEEEGTTFSVPAPGLSSSLDVFERGGDGSLKVRFTDKVGGKMALRGEEWPLDDLQQSEHALRGTSVRTEKGAADTYTVDLEKGDWGVLDLGPIEIFFQVLDKTDAVAGRGVSDIEWPLVALIGLSLLGHAVFLIAAFLMWGVQPDLERKNIPDRFVEFMVEDIKDPLEEDEDEPSEDTTGKKAGGKEGKFGDPDKEKPESKIPKQDGKMKKKLDVKNIGVNKALSSKKIGGALKNMFSDQEGFDSKMKVAMSGEGSELAVGRGAGGMGLKGTGSGGGGEGFGRVHGLGDVDTGGGKGTGAKVGRKKEREVKPQLDRQKPEVGDFCDKGNIQRVVGRKSASIKHCYQKELQSNPKLKGKIIAQWKVGLDGSVMSTSVVSSTMNNGAVESCITRVIRRMRFAKPDGGICVINYPFVFTGMN